MTGDRVVLGRIIGVHGIGGEVAIRTENDDPSGIGRYSSVFWVDPASTSRGTASPAGRRVPDDRPLTIETTRVHRGVALVRFAEIHDRDAAEELIGGRIEVPFAERRPAAEGEFYVSDLIGLTVVTRTGEAIGPLVAVYPSGAHDLFGVDRGGREVLIPAVDAFVVEIDLPGRRIVVDPPEGLLE